MEAAAHTDTAGHTAYMRLRGGNTLGLRGEHRLGQDTADDACEGHAAGCELGDGREKRTHPRTRRGEVASLAWRRGCWLTKPKTARANAPHTMLAVSVAGGGGRTWAA